MAIGDLFRNRRGRSEADPADLDHLRTWASTRWGIEGFVEPETLVSPTGLCLVAFDGEWTRRPVGNLSTARRLARELRIPVSDVTVTGYPPRMREFEQARLAVERRERRERLRRAVEDQRGDGARDPSGPDGA